jgi:O-antigen ligase
MLRMPQHFGTLTKLVGLCSGFAIIFLIIRRRQWVRPPMAAFIWLLLLGWMSLSVFWALDPSAAADELTTMAELTLLYLVITVAPITLAEYKAFLTAVVLGGLFDAIYAIYLYHTGAFTQYAHFQGVLSSRLLVRFGDEKLDPNAFSSAFLLPLAIVLTWAMRRSISLSKIVLMGVFLVLVTAMYVNGSRGALLGLAALVAYMALRGRFRIQLVALSTIGFVASFFLPQSPWQRFANAAATGGAGRLSIWKVGLEAFKHNWLFGSGIGMFPYEYDRNFIRVFQSHYADWHRAPHNMLVGIGVELGIVGLFLFLSAFYMQFRMLRDIHPSDDLSDIAIALEAATVGMFVVGLFLGTLQLKSTWLLFGVTAMARSLELRSKAPESMHSRASPRSIGPPVRSPISAQGTTINA